jgi:hypothetical protein
LAQVYFALGLGAQTHRERTEETLRMLKNHFETNPSPTPRR